MTPEVTLVPGRRGLLSLLPLNRQKILKETCSRSFNVSVLIKEGVYFYWKKSEFFLIRVLY